MVNQIGEFPLDLKSSQGQAVRGMRKFTALGKTLHSVTQGCPTQV
jgi:hypothetical protein